MVAQVTDLSLKNNHENGNFSKKIKKNLVYTTKILGLPLCRTILADHPSLGVTLSHHLSQWNVLRPVVIFAAFATLAIVALV